VVHRDYWTPENPNALFPRPYIAGDHNYLYSDKWLMNGQYARLKNVQIGYSLPAKLLSRAKISKIRLFISAQDILTVSKLGNFKGYFDPEQRDGIENDYHMGMESPFVQSKFNSGIIKIQKGNRQLILDFNL
jgi:hypothetical protein